MKKRIAALAMTVAMAMSLLPVSAFAADFGDTDGHWGKDSIDRWTSVGVLNGKGEGVFDPDGSMTRAEFAQMLANMLGYSKKSAAGTFGDVAADAWYADAILKLAAAGVMTGDGAGNANPNAQITREEAAVMLCRAFSIQPKPGASLDFADADSVSGWARDAVATLAELGMMNGVGNNQVAPQLNINRASVATLVDNMVAEYVTENKTISGEVNGVVVVAADANVTLENATLEVPLVVAPKAEGAEVILTGTTAASDVVVDAANAKVSVEKDAAVDNVSVAGSNANVAVAGKAETVAVEAANAKVEVAGTVSTVDVANDAAGSSVNVNQGASVGSVTAGAANANVNVAQDATVDKVTVSGAGTKVDVNGTVSNVTVAEGANNATVSTGSTAKIDNVTTSAQDVKVSGTGTVGTVTADKGSVDVTVKDTEVKNEGADKATAGDKEVSQGESGKVEATTPSGGGGGTTTTTPSNDAGVVAAPLEDHPSEGTPATNLGTVTVSSRKTSADNATPKVYEVTIKGTNIKNHHNAEHASGHWVGFGMPIDKTPATEGGAAPTYTYKVNNASDPTPSIAGREYPVGTQVYNTVYFSEEANGQYADYTIHQWKDGAEVAKYVVKFDVTFGDVTIEKATLQIRPAVGYANGNASFNYGEAYKAAGIDFKPTAAGAGRITVDQNKTVELLAAADGSDETAKTLATTRINAIKQTSSGEDAECLFIGVAVKAPTGATGLTVNGDEKTFPGVDSAGHDVFVDETGTYYISYYPAIKSDGGVCPTKTWPAELLVWTGENDQVLRTETFTITRDAATPAEMTVTFKNDSTVVATEKTSYNGTVTLPEDIPAAEGKGFTGWYVSDQKFTSETKVTANTEVSAKWTANPIPKATGVNASLTGVPTSLGITASASDNVVTVSIPGIADLQSKYDALDATGKAALNHNDKLYIRVNSNVPTVGAGASPIKFFTGSTENGKEGSWRAKCEMTKAALNDKGIDVTMSGSDIATIGQWFSFATVTKVTDGEGNDTLVLTNVPKSWTVIYRWTAEDGTMQYTTLTVNFVAATPAPTPTPGT